MSTEPDSAVSVAVLRRLVRRLASAGTKLTVLDVLAMRERRALGDSLRSLAVEFDVHFVTVKRICEGDEWRWLSSLPDDERAALVRCLHPNNEPPLVEGAA